MIKLYKIIIAEEEGWITENPQDFENEISEYEAEFNQDIDTDKTIANIKKLKVGEEFEVEELKFKCIEMDMEEYSNLGEWGGW